MELGGSEQEHMHGYTDINEGIPCSCCYIWQTLEKVPRCVEISKQSVLYKLERTSSILPGKHIINSLKPNVAGGNALFKEIFGSSDDQLTLCSHSKDICGIGTTCLYHSLHKHLKLLIGRAKRCPCSKILKKHILDKKDLYCSKGQVVSFIWAASRSIVPEELLGNLRPLRKNISKFIKLRLYEKFSLHECMHKLKISDFSFLSNKHSLCDFKFGEIRGIVLERCKISLPSLSSWTNRQYLPKLQPLRTQILPRQHGRIH
ncbi:telomerase reverse transcriptase-like [Lactuca sativa]|uniref:telomerase reverse transcriptase-like n=1 Tax=Lactuca sativa TaxID=4236 RepID=UPI000CD9D408|nr:telomerase reverse transcriptase-like [Lactuca sativa]